MNTLQPIRLDVLESVPGLVHGFFTRQGGASSAPYDALNMAVSTGDTIDNVSANIEKAAMFMGLKQLVAVYQVHGTDIVAVDGYIPEIMGDTLCRADGLVTDRIGVGLLIKIADCQAVLAVDPIKRCLGAVHAGWRGLINGAVPNLIKAMVRKFGCNPSDILTGLGPSLGPCCAEFINYRTEFPETVWPYNIGNDHFDLWSAAKDQLEATGLKPANIEAVEMCTRCRGDLFFSHRGQGPITGRLGAIIGFVD